MRNGLAFLAGWTLTVAALAFVLFELADGAGISDSDPAWIAAVDLVLGVLFLVATLTVWRRRRAPSAPRLHGSARSTGCREAAPRRSASCSPARTRR